MRLIPLLLALPAVVAAQTPEQLFEQRKYDDAKAAFQAQLAKNKNDANALYYMGRIAEEAGKSGDAINWFEKAVKVNDTSALYHFWLGNALGTEAQNASKLRQPFLARRVKSEYERAVQLDPKMLGPRDGLVNFYSMAPGVMGGSMDKARAQATEIDKLHPFRGYFAMARIAQRQKDVAAEAKAYEDAVKAAPDSNTTWYSLGAYYRRQSRFDEAFAIHDTVMRRWPVEIVVHAAYGFTASMSGKNLDRGEREMKQYLAGPPQGVSDQSLSFYRYHLGQIYEKTNRKEMAKGEYAQALKLNPKSAEAKKAQDALR